MFPKYYYYFLNIYILYFLYVMCKLIEASRWVSEGGSLSILIDQNTELAQNLDLIANSSFPDSRNLTLAGGTIFKV